MSESCTPAVAEAVPAVVEKKKRAAPKPKSDKPVKADKPAKTSKTSKLATPSSSSSSIECASSVSPSVIEDAKVSTESSSDASQAKAMIVEKYNVLTYAPKRPITNEEIDFLVNLRKEKGEESFMKWYTNSLDIIEFLGFDYELLDVGFSPSHMFQMNPNKEDNIIFRVPDEEPFEVSCHDCGVQTVEGDPRSTVDMSVYDSFLSYVRLKVDCIFHDNPKYDFITKVSDLFPGREYNLSRYHYIRQRPPLRHMDLFGDPDIDGAPRRLEPEEQSCLDMLLIFKRHYFLKWFTTALHMWKLAPNIQFAWRDEILNQLKKVEVGESLIRFAEPRAFLNVFTRLPNNRVRERLVEVFLDYESVTFRFAICGTGQIVRSMDEVLKICQTF